MMSCLNVTDIVANSTITAFDPIAKRLPTEIDWRTRGYITPVKDQVNVHNSLMILQMTSE